MSSLKTYDEKRDFKQTAEPKGAKRKSAGKQHIFVIQRHHASRLHYDFRLEVDGVLKSWAVPKGPSMNPADKRLAMQVEDHPYDYKDFEGVIPEGNYGAGYVYVWDKGNYELLREDGSSFDKAANKEIKEGDLKIRLKGRKVKGEFALVKMKNTADNAWLLLKHKDDYAVKDAYNSEDFTPQRVKDRGVKEKEKMKGEGKKKVSPAKVKAASQKGKTVKKAKQQRALFTPMMATLVDAPFNREGWLFETKWDGYRAIADVRNGKVELYSRNHLSFNKDYAPVVEALEKLQHDAVLDGEIVILKKDGTSDFQSLQNYKNDPSGNLVYVVFDMLELDGEDLKAMPLIQRKELLKTVVKQLKNKGVVYSEHISDNSDTLYQQAKEKGWEGIIAKEAESLYAEGKRAMAWLKIKIIDEQEAIICGYTDPKGSRKKIGSLVLGVYDDNKELRYVGNCGGGLNGTLINELYEKMQPLRQKSSPFDKKIRTNTPVTWVKPQLVCQVKFSSWTSDKQLRQPVFLGLRKDKPAKEVHQETAKSTKMATKKAAVTAAPAKAAPEKERVVTLNSKKVPLTNQQKLYWPDEKITKGELIDYYMEMADYVLPYLKDRPLSLHRFPNGIKDAGFYQKDVDTAAAPDWVKTVTLHAASASRDVDYLVCNNAATLVYMANLGCIEMNPWLSRVKNLDNPDYIVLDLDPENIAFKYVVETALAIKELLDKVGVKSFCKTSGASGLHIYVPTGGKYNYETCRLFAEYVAKQVQQELPKITSVIRTKSKRNKKVYIDYMQNSRGQTVASPYSVRPKPGATVSAPLNWDELNEDLAISNFTMENMRDRVKAMGNLWKDIDKTKNDLRKAIAKVESMAQAQVE
ncbi:bifunctional non-homologous end joining protein LigD [Chitinophaga sp. YR627]|uniref:DNA ligase D n=1 Tax=Chitinophaga sp. YR627 TaxID=1881041 RepID=UPI0008E3CD64|nr:DNA ligase D [Chitinophaga sp. YR627]SFN89109.1 bifunctional non-homologous end joining protein LigD [Chitinophaga sp. YR627]